MAIKFIFFSVWCACSENNIMCSSAWLLISGLWWMMLDPLNSFCRGSVVFCLAGLIWVLHYLLWQKSAQWSSAAMSRVVPLLLSSWVSNLSLSRFFFYLTVIVAEKLIQWFFLCSSILPIMFVRVCFYVSVMFKSAFILLIALFWISKCN